MYDGADIVLNFSYGSKHDGSSWLGFICDGCADELRERMKAAPTVGDWLHGDKDE